jgi:tetratricopeptide (TPR) repeat protein
VPRQLFGYGRSDRSSTLIGGLGSKARAGFRSRRGDGHDRIPVTPHNALFASYKALAIDPKSENALFVRGAARQHLADYSGAIRDYSDALRLDPSRADALFARGTANYSAGEYQAAVADFSKAIDLGYADHAVFYLRELAQSELGHRSDARSE